MIDNKLPTALLMGRYQGFHFGHKTLILEALNRVGQVCIAVRDTQGIDDKNPFSFEEIKLKIETELKDYLDKIEIIQVPNITNIFYGRNVGYDIEQIFLPKEIEEISATKTRQKLLNR